MMSIIRGWKQIGSMCYSTSCPVDCRALSLLAVRSSRISPPSATVTVGGVLQHLLLTDGLVYTCPPQSCPFLCGSGPACMCQIALYKVPQLGNQLGPHESATKPDRRTSAVFTQFTADPCARTMRNNTDGRHL